MEPYVDFAYYTNTFKGTAIPQAAFDKLARQASYFIRDITFNRIDPEEIIEEVKDATCAVAEFMREHDGEEGKISETTGDHSVTYDVEHNPTDARTYKTARPYLIHTGLLYLGVDR